MNEEKISWETVISREAGLITADLEGEKAMMSIEKGKYYGLNTVGSLIWELLGQPINVQGLIEELMKEFQVDEDTCLKDVSFFLNKMYQEGLVSLV